MNTDNTLCGRIAAQISELRFNMAGAPGARAVLDTLAQIAESSAGLTPEVQEAERRAMLANDIFPSSSARAEGPLRLEDGSQLQGIPEMEAAAVKLWSTTRGVERVEWHRLHEALKVEMDQPEMSTLFAFMEMMERIFRSIRISSSKDFPALQLLVDRINEMPGLAAAHKENERLRAENAELRQRLGEI